MQHHREPIAAILAAFAVFAGLVAPGVALVVALVIVGAGMAIRVHDVRIGSRREVQNPR